MRVPYGCVLSPLLFNVILEAAIGVAPTKVEAGAMIGGTVLSNLRFADDISATGESNKDLQEIMCNISAESERMGMELNTDKTEVQYIRNDNVIVDIQINGQCIAQADEFVYLGGKITQTGSSDKDIKRRIGLAS